MQIELKQPEATLSSEVLGARLRSARINKGLTQEEAGEAVGMSRLVLLQIEAGTRAVSSLELVRLSRFYGRQVDEFLGSTDLEETPQLVLGRVAPNSPHELHQKITPFLEQLREVVRLARFLGENSLPVLPLYQFGDPSSYKEAVDQGRDMAILERKRLDLGSAAVTDIAAVISCQAVWTAAVPLPSDVSGLFLRHSEYGLAVLINEGHSRARRRFSYAHEYAHALVDREKSSAPTSRQNANELVEKRANAFASEFLMPEAGVWESLERMQKGGASREFSMLYDVASGEALSHETRNDSTAQRITVSEAAILAHEFQVSYDVAVYRLNDIGAIKRPHLEELLLPAQKENGKKLIEHLELYNGDADAGEEQPHLKRQLVWLSIQALRRDRISKSDFCRVCGDIAGYDEEQANQLLEIAVTMV